MSMIRANVESYVAEHERCGDLIVRLASIVAEMPLPLDADKADLERVRELRSVLTLAVADVGELTTMTGRVA